MCESKREKAGGLGKGSGLHECSGIRICAAHYCFRLLGRAPRLIAAFPRTKSNKEEAGAKQRESDGGIVQHAAAFASHQGLSPSTFARHRAPNSLSRHYTCLLCFRLPYFLCFSSPLPRPPSPPLPRQQRGTEIHTSATLQNSPLLFPVSQTSRWYLRAQVPY